MAIDLKKILTEKGWEDTAPECKGKDKELLKTLSLYASHEEDEFDLRVKTLGKVAALASTLKSANEVKTDADAVKYLVAMIAATKTKQAEIAKAKAEASKTQAAAQKKADADAKKKEEAEQKAAQKEAGTEEDEEEEEDSDSIEKLKKAFMTLKTAKMPYYFLVCEAKPYGLVVSKKDIRKSMLHKKELATLAGGNTRPPKSGTCRRESNTLVFEMEKPPAGLARILQKWIKTSTSLGFKVMVGTESAEDEEPGAPGAEVKAGGAQQAADAKAAANEKAAAAKQAAAEKAAAAKQAAEEKKALEERRALFKKSRAAWITVKAKAEADLEKVKDGARMAYLTDPKQYPKVVKGCKDIDDILDHLDDELRDTLDQYAATPLGNKAKLHTL